MRSQVSNELPCKSIHDGRADACAGDRRASVERTSQQQGADAVDDGANLRPYRESSVNQGGCRWNERARTSTQRARGFNEASGTRLPLYNAT